MVEIAGLLVLGFLAQWIGWRIKIPAILPLILVGLCVGPFSTFITENGEKFIEGDQIFSREFFFDIVGLSVGLILFEGGLTLKYKEIKEHWSSVGLLILLTPLIVMGGLGITMKYLMDFTTQSALLFGALLIVTGPTVIGPILRNVRPNTKINTILKWESILIDPIGALIAVLTYEYILSENLTDPDLGWFAAKNFGLTLVIGIGVGSVTAFSIYYLIKKNLVPPYLRNVVVLALVIAAFAFSDFLHAESGLLSVTIMGMVMTNLKFPYLKEITHFNEEIVLILISFLFVMLSSRIDIGDITMILRWESAVILGVIIFILRPLTIFLSTIKSGLSFKEKLFISWIGPRGIVAAAMASLFSMTLIQEVTMVPIDQAYMLVSLTFMVIVSTVVLQGLTAKPLAKLLGVTRKSPNGIIFLSADMPARHLAKFLKKEGIPVMLADTSVEHVQQSRDVGFTTYHGSLLDEDTLEKLDFSKYGQLIALTPNDQINSLACKFLSAELGATKVYRLVAKKELKLTVKQQPTHLLMRGMDNSFKVLKGSIKKSPEIHTLILEDKDQLDNFLNEEQETILGLFILKKSPTYVIPISQHDINITKGDRLAYIKKSSPAQLKEALEELENE
jgi:NhaP-type Na+/H+ or K+/H+ antiporter